MMWCGGITFAPSGTLYPAGYNPSDDFALNKIHPTNASAMSSIDLIMAMTPSSLASWFF